MTRPLSLLVLVTALLGAGCPKTDDSAAPSCRDEDGDGYGVGDERAGCSHGEPDCDDGDARINPGAVETCNGVDDDCDGASDEEGALGAETFHADADGDGYGDAEAATEACEQASGMVEDDSDCDDGDAEVNPDAAELCNGVDDDCDGQVDEDDAADAATWYRDADEDGYGDAEEATTACDQPSGFVEDDGDCDDEHDDVNPGAFDHGNGLDDDCDGVVDRFFLSDGAAFLIGEREGDHAGEAMQRIDDVDGDGLDDLLVGANEAVREGPTGGRVYLLSAASLAKDGSELALEDALLTIGSVTGGAALGSGMSRAGDHDGDGVGDLLLGAPNWEYAGGAFLVPGSAATATPGDHDITDLALATLHGPGDGYDDIGAAVAGGEDFDGDGHADLLLGGWQSTGDAGDCGRAWLVPGPVLADLSLEDVDTVVEGEEDGHRLGWALANAGDTDGDGLADWWVAAPYAGGEDRGEVYLFANGARGALIPDDATATLYGRNEEDHLGYSLAGQGDIDNDGYDDVIMGARGYSSERGRAYVVLGPHSGRSCVCGGSDGSLIGNEDGDLLGHAVTLGHANGDELADLLVGAPGVDEGGAHAGATYLYLGPMGGSRLAEDADATLLGWEADMAAGTSVAFAPDLTGSAREEWLIGAELWDTTGTDAGGAVLVLAPGVRW